MFDFNNANPAMLVVLGIVAMIMGYTTFRFLPKIVDWIFDKTPILNRVDKTIAYFVSESVGIGVMIVLAILGFGELPESAAAIAVLLTVASGAFIFTSEGWVTDAFAGLSLQLFPQYKVGEWVTLNGKRGRVIRVGLFRTQLATKQLDVVSVKNAKILGGDIINHSGIRLEEFKLLVRIADYGQYGHDLDAFKAEALEIVKAVQDQMCPEAQQEHGKSPQILFSEFGPSADHITVKFFDRETGASKALDAINSTFATTFRPKGVIFGDVSALVLVSSDDNKA